MKRYLIALASLVIYSPSCNLPPNSMGDGASRQIGLLNLNLSRRDGVAQPVKPNVSVTISYPTN